MARFLTGLFGSNKQTQAPATSLRVNTSLQGTPIAILLAGENRLSCNLIDYFGFNYQNAPTSGGGGKGGVFGGGSGKGQSGQYDYFTSFIAAICEGPVSDLIDILVNGSTILPAGTGPTPGGGDVSTTGLEFFDGDYSQTAWGYAEAVEPTRALAYRGIAYAAAANYALGSSASMPNFTFVLLAANNTFLAGQPDGDPTIALSDFLTNGYWGLGFPSARIGSFASWQSYCQALGFAVSPVIASSVSASSFASDLLTATNSDACWQDGLLTVVPYGDQTVTAGQVTTISEPHTVPALLPNASYAVITVGNVGTFVADKGVVYDGGAAFVAVNTYPGSTGQYYMASPGVYYFNSGDVGASVDISYSYAATASYVPDIEPIYDFTIDDFLPNQGTIGQGISAATSPLIVVRKPRDQMLNVIKIEYLDRNNAYNPVKIERRDSASIATYKRLRPSDIKQLHFFCLASAAVQSAMLQLGRAQIPRTFQWTVGKHFILILQLMKIATVTDAGQNLFRQPVRIIEIQENTDGTLTLTAEEFMGTATSPVYGTQASQGTARNYNADPGSINPPLIFEPTDELGSVLISGGGLMIAGAISGVDVDLWGGCEVWASYEQDGTYDQVGTIFGPARMGVLTAPLPSYPVNPTGQTIDQTNTLSVDLTESGGVLSSGSQIDATSLNTRCFVGPRLGSAPGEIVSYETATLTATSKYDLTYLVRGAYGTEDEIATWAAGTSFARLDQGIFAFPYDQSRIGSTVYFKFRSFNIYRGGTQDLANLPTFTYVITGAALASPLPDVANLRTAYVDSRTVISWDEISDFRPVLYEIRQGGAWASALSLGTQAHPPFAVPGDNTYWVSGVSQPASGLTVYSETAQSIVVEGSLIDGNILVAHDVAAAGWPGTFTGGANKDVSINAIRTGGAANILADPNVLVNPNILDSGGEQSGTYEIDSSLWIDAGYGTILSLGVAFSGQGVPVGQDILSIADFLNVPDILGSASTQYTDIYLNVATSPDGASPSWGSWQKFVPGDYPGRWAKFQVNLGTIDPNTIAYCTKLILTALIPARVDQYLAQTVPSTGLTITFTPNGTTTARAFNGGPAQSGSSSNANLPGWNGAITNATPGDDIIISNLTLAGCTVFVQNGGSNVTRNNVNLQFFGY